MRNGKNDLIVFVFRKKGLEIVFLFISCRGISGMPNRGISHESFGFADVFVNIEHQTFIFNIENFSIFHHRNSARFLAAVLQSKKPELRK